MWQSRSYARRTTGNLGGFWQGGGWWERVSDLAIPTSVFGLEYQTHDSIDEGAYNRDFVDQFALRISNRLSRRWSRNQFAGLLHCWLLGMLFVGGSKLWKAHGGGKRWPHRLAQGEKSPFPRSIWEIASSTSDQVSRRKCLGAPPQFQLSYSERLATFQSWNPFKSRNNSTTFAIHSLIFVKI